MKSLKTIRSLSIFWIATLTGTPSYACRFHNVADHLWKHFSQETQQLAPDWAQWFDRYIDSSEVFRDIGEIEARTEHLSLDERLKLVHEIRKRYDHLMTIPKPIRNKNHRRSLEELIRVIIQPEKILLNQFDDPVQLRQGYDRYLSVMQEALGGGSRGSYDSEKIIEAAKILQTGLLKVKETAIANGKVLPKDAHVLMYGSFPNGVADLKTSDIDTTLNRFYPGNVGVNAPGKLFDGFVNDALQKLVFRGISHVDGISDRLSAARIHPVQIVIYADRIELHAYSGPVIRPGALPTYKKISVHLLE